VSGLATSDEKNTDAVTALISISMPAFWQACLTIAWFFWRGWLIESGRRT
jgi:ABC-type dipeptide/oligopeptide/nickel transport system permease component